MSALLKALNAPRRREILRLVWDGERSAGDIHREMADVTFGAVSQHLRVLAEAGLVAQRSQGRHRFYSARKRELGGLRAWLEAQWGSALDRLQIEAELEAARRGPRAGAASRSTTRRPARPQPAGTRTPSPRRTPPDSQSPATKKKRERR